MTIEVPCRRCGEVFAPAPAAFRAGAWRTCRACTAKSTPLRGRNPVTARLATQSAIPGRREAAATPTDAGPRNLREGSTPRNNPMDEEQPHERISAMQAFRPR